MQYDDAAIYILCESFNAGLERYLQLQVDNGNEYRTSKIAIGGNVYLSSIAYQNKLTDCEHLSGGVRAKF